MLLKTGKVVNTQIGIVNHALSLFCKAVGQRSEPQLPVHDAKHFTERVIFPEKMTEMNLIGEPGA